MSFKFDVGDMLKDTITGFQGVAVARTQWLNGCMRYQLQPTKLAKDGKLQDEAVFDEHQLSLVKAAAVPNAATGKGGPQRDSRSPVRALLR